MSAPILLCDGFDVRRILIGKFNGDDSSTVTTEEEDEEAVFSGDSLLGDAAEEDEEWSEDNHICYYFVKQHAYDDPEIKAKIDEADNEIYQCNTERIHIANSLKSKRAERLSLVASMESLISSLDEYNAIFPQQLLTMEINEVKEEEEMVTEKIYSLSDRLREIKMEMDLFDVQMACVLDQRDRAFERIRTLRIQRDRGNAAFFQSRVVMEKAMELAASGNVTDLEELANAEIDRFMSRWNNDKAFRDDYEKRIIPSLDERKLRRDGRIRDPECDEYTENGDETTGKKAIELKRFSTEEESDDGMDFDIPVYEKLRKEEEEEEIDEETLKEKKREEQIEKARLAMERKRKLHEKAAAKSARRMKKEAEKRIKALEKRAKKKMQRAVFNSSSSSDVDRTTTERATEASELEKEKLINGRSVFPKQRSFRSRHQGKENETVLKAIIKRRRAYRLWVWTVSSAAVALTLALLVIFFCIR